MMIIFILYALSMKATHVCLLCYSSIGVREIQWFQEKIHDLKKMCHMEDQHERVNEPLSSKV